MKKFLLLGLVLFCGVCFGQRNLELKKYRDKIIPSLLSTFADNDESRGYSCYYLTPVIILEENLNVISDMFIEGPQLSRSYIQSKQFENCIVVLKRIKDLFGKELPMVFEKANILTIGFVYNSKYLDDNRQIHNYQTTYFIEIEHLNNVDLESKLIKW